jgi:hypothetical protein
VDKWISSQANKRPSNQGGIADSFLTHNQNIKFLYNMSNEKEIVCTICGVEEDDQFVKGELGMLPVQFCVWCLSGLIDMAEQLNPCPCRDDDEK